MTLLERSMPFELTRDAVDGDGRTLEGYAAVFGAATRIASWEGTFDETIAPGAFRKTLRERTPVLQFDHGRHPMVGSIPLGSIGKLREDDKGLYVNAELHDNWLVQPVRDAIASGSIDGMSFRFEVVQDEWRDKRGNVIDDRDEVRRRLYSGDPKDVLSRTLKEVKLPELGPVVFPAYRQTSVAVRSVLDALSLDDLDNEARTELARLLVSGTSPQPSREGREADDEAAPADEPPTALPAVIPNGAGLSNLHRLARRTAV